MPDPSWVTPRADPDAPTAGSARVFEVTDLLIPAGTDWSNLGHHFGQVSIEPGGTMICSMVMVLSAPPDPLGPSITFAAARGGPDWATNAARYRVVLPGAQETDIWGFASTLVPFFNNSVASNALSDDAEFRVNLDPYWRSTSGGDFGTPPEDAVLDIGIWTDGPTTADITVVRARAAFLVL